ncbi:LanC-like protein 3 [Holothuria leucospilota]|uniref:LanC-like protein 3 n=1 Tax=Holothuria leucospilota TaxID=206669 RepID=A0A9Q0YTP2_HOLLE|nr:LanC-like protein 3 [Holothuria leucospilota]
MFNQKIFHNWLAYLKRTFTMARNRGQRYFENKFTDYVEGQNVEIPREAIRELVTGITKDIVRRFTVNHHSCDGGLYVGVAGVAYSMVRLLQSPYQFDIDRNEVCNFTRRCVEVSLDYEERFQSKEVRPGLLLGTGGVLITAAMFYNQLHERREEIEKLLQRYASFAEICTEHGNPDYLRCGSDEILIGRAGYLCGLHTLRTKLKEEILKADKVNRICKTMIDVGRQTARHLHSEPPLMYQYHNTQYLGAAHGLSGILYSLLLFPGFLEMDREAEKEIKDSVDYFILMQQKRGDGNFATVADEALSPGLVHWCHGAPGVVYLLAKAYTFWNEEKYLAACVTCADLCWKYGLLRKGPGICHGVAGNGYVFLLLYRLTNQPKYLYRAIKFAEFLQTEEFRSEARVPDSPYSLYEGWAGTLCYLLDLLEPDKAEFPFNGVL